MRRPSKSGTRQLITVVLLAAATAGVVVANDMTQSPRGAASAVAANPSSKVVGEEPSSQPSRATAAAPSWLLKTAKAALASNSERPPSSAYWGVAAASDDAWGVLGAGETDKQLYWLVFTGDFVAGTPALPSSLPESHGRCLVLAVRAADHAVVASAVMERATVDPAGLSWLRPLKLS